MEARKHICREHSTVVLSHRFRNKTRIEPIQYQNAQIFILFISEYSYITSKNSHPIEMQLFIRNRSVVFRNGINRKPLRGSFGWCIPFSPSSRLRRQLGATRPPPYGVHDGTKKAREASSRAVDALNDIAIDYLATLSLKSAIILSHSGT